MMRKLWATHRATILHWSMEIFVVMLGVLLALGVQQWAEDRAARQRAADAEDRIRQELLGNAQYLIERVAIQPCLTQRLAALKQGVARGDKGWRASTLPSNVPGDRVFDRVYGVPIRPFSSEVFRSVGNSGDMAAVAPDRFAELSQVYSAMTRVADANREEQRIAVKLAPLSVLGLGDARSKAEMVSDLASLDAANGLASAVAQQIIVSLASLDYRFTAEEARLWGPELRDNLMASGRKLYGSCYDSSGGNALFRQLLANPAP